MNEKKKYWWIAAVGVTTLLIWANSAVPREQSSMMSSGLVRWLQEVLGWEVPELLVRKAGHFCEYALLGVEYTFLYRSGQRNGQWRFNYLALGLMTAVADESVQILSGRGPMVADILLDFAGFGSGFGLVLLLVLLVNQRNKT